MRHAGRASSRSVPVLAIGFWLALACPCAERLGAQSTPAVGTLAVTNLDTVNASNALAQASVNPNGASTTLIFQYGTDLSYGSVSAPVFVSPGNGAVQISATIFPTVPNMLFHVRAVASNSFGTTLGADVT